MAENSIATAYVQVRPSMDGVAPAVRKEFKGVGESVGSETGASLGTNLAGKLKTVLAAAGIGKMLGKALTEGAALEQSLGGVETLFKDSAQTVIANAREAYRTAGMSANGYMEQVTGFSASLLQSLGGDTAKAAIVADMALTDMSDNANKFGTDMLRITDAYQGFAKQNYTLLDNLKLGYGGTKTEMERLLADAQKLTGVKYDISNLSDVYNAIHAIQDELGVTGTTAKEAASTMSGSFNAMKASAANVLGNLALGENVMPSLNALSKTTSTFLVGNFIPMVVNTISAIPGAMVSLVTGTSAQIRIKLSEDVPVLGSLFYELEGAILAAGAAYAGFKTGNEIVKLAKPIIAEAAGAAEIWSYQIGKVEMAQLALNGEMTVGQAVLSVLTGKMSITTLAQAGMTAAQNSLNAAMSANPIGFVIAGVAALGAAIGKSIHDINELAKSFEIQAETSADAEAHLEELIAQLDTYERNPNKRTMQEREEYAALEKAIEATKLQIVDLQQKEMEAAAAAAAAAADPVNIFNSATEQYAADATNLYETFVATYEGMFDKVSGWFGPFETASVSVKTSIDEMMSAMQSQIDFNTRYAENLQYLKDSGLGGLSEAFQSCGASGSAYADAIVSALKEAGGATTADGQKIVRDFQGLSDGVTQSQSALSETMTLMSGDIETSLKSIGETYSGAIDNLNKSEEAKAAAESTFGAFLEGIESETPGILSAMENLGQQISASLQSGISPINVPVSVSGGNSLSRFKGGSPSRILFDGSHASGLDYVPYDGYIAELHRGEMIVPAKEASQLRDGGTATGRVVNVVQNIYSEAKTAADLMQEARYQAERAVILGV